MYQKSNILGNFFIAGYQFHDGPFVENKLKPGTKLRLVDESDNPYDNNAVAIYYKDTMLGYVPANGNEIISQLLYFGHGKTLKAVVVGCNKDAKPYERVLVSVRFRDNR